MLAAKIMQAFLNKGRAVCGRGRGCLRLQLSRREGQGQGGSGALVLAQHPLSNSLPSQVVRPSAWARTRWPHGGHDDGRTCQAAACSQIMRL